jgi:hypothetical protein
MYGQKQFSYHQLIHLIYMEKWKISASGTFDEVRKIAPDFDKQANLMGL